MVEAPVKEKHTAIIVEIDSVRKVYSIDGESRPYRSLGDITKFLRDNRLERECVAYLVVAKDEEPVLDDLLAEEEECKDFNGKEKDDRIKEIEERRRSLNSANGSGILELNGHGLVLMDIKRGATMLLEKYEIYGSRIRLCIMPSVEDGTSGYYP